VAFHAAVRGLQNGDCDLALAGGVNVLGSPGFFVEFSKQHALSDDGHCRAYSAQASGTVWAEGAAVFVLQRKSAALRDGRHILAEVRGSATNHDGRSAGLSAPNGAAQVSLFRRAISQAGIRPDEVGMVEGHGTGTRLGDRTELQSLAQTYGATEPGRGALLGSVKSNLGHALAASGALGLAKILVAAEHGAIPPTLHAAEASPEIDWEKQGLRLANTLTPWPAVDGRRVAATSAFGIAGTNAHVIVSLPEAA
jgi:mycobactin polyketide synthetase MbtC